MDGAPVLVVDDDDSIRSMVAEVRDLEGYTVATAANGVEALQFVEEQRPLLVLLDMRMPVLDGWGFARELKTRVVKLPILVMTAARSALVPGLSKIDADGFVAKPFDFADLVSAVQGLGAQAPRSHPSRRTRLNHHYTSLPT